MTPKIARDWLIVSFPELMTTARPPFVVAQIRARVATATRRPHFAHGHRLGKARARKNPRRFLRQDVLALGARPRRRGTCGCAMPAALGGRPRRRPEGLLPAVSASAAARRPLAPPLLSAWLKDCVR